LAIPMTHHRESYFGHTSGLPRVCGMPAVGAAVVKLRTGEPLHELFHGRYISCGREIRLV
jgi:hypothetical protein